MKLLLVPFLFLSFCWVAQAQNQGDPAEFLVVKITPQIIERDQSVSWEQPLTKVTRAGNPVVVKIDADALAVKIIVTPFVRGSDFLLVVQGDVKQANGTGTRRSSTVQSLLVPPGEPIAFFPLGREPGESGRQMVVMIRVEFPHE